MFSQFEEKYEAAKKEILDLINDCENSTNQKEREFSEFILWLLTSNTSFYRIFQKKEDAELASYSIEGFNRLMHLMHHAIIDDGIFYFIKQGRSPKIYIGELDLERNLEEQVLDPHTYNLFLNFSTILPGAAEVYKIEIVKHSSKFSALEFIKEFEDNKKWREKNNKIFFRKR